MSKKQEYVKPGIRYWAAEKLDVIEAKMSGGGGGGTPDNPYAVTGQYVERDIGGIIELAAFDAVQVIRMIAVNPLIDYNNSSNNRWLYRIGVSLAAAGEAVQDKTPLEIFFCASNFIRNTAHSTNIQFDFSDDVNEGGSLPTTPGDRGRGLSQLSALFNLAVTQVKSYIASVVLAIIDVVVAFQEPEPIDPFTTERMWDWFPESNNIFTYYTFEIRVPPNTQVSFQIDSIFLGYLCEDMTPRPVTVHVNAPSITTDRSVAMQKVSFNMVQSFESPEVIPSGAASLNASVLAKDDLVNELKMQIERSKYVVKGFSLIETPDAKTLSIIDKHLQRIEQFNKMLIDIEAAQADDNQMLSEFYGLLASILADDNQVPSIYSSSLD